MAALDFHNSNRSPAPAVDVEAFVTAPVVEFSVTEAAKFEIRTEHLLLLLRLRMELNEENEARIGALDLN